MQEKLYTGSTAGMKTSPWLSSEDFMERGDVPMTITGVYAVTGAVLQDGQKRDLFAISFDKTEKRLVMNATNRKVLAMSFGADTTKWIGQKVRLFVQDGIRNPNGGATVSGIRIKTHLTPSK